MSTYNLKCGALASPYSTRKHKRTYETLELAMQARDELLRKGRNQRPYKCTSCGMYHLTTSGQRK